MQETEKEEIEAERKIHEEKHTAEILHNSM